MQAVDLSPVVPSAQTQRPGDLFLIFLGANIVATTLQVGASLVETLAVGPALAVIALGATGGAALVARLAPIGSRLGVPSIVATRAALGFSGARTLAVGLFVTNFAWIALNDAIAASIVVRLTGFGTTAIWAVGLGLLATFVVGGGPRGVALADRLAVPLLVVSGLVFTVACLRLPWPSLPAGSPPSAASTLRGLDVVAGYQMSWLLMFADYPRYVRSGAKAALAVFAGLTVAALWFMPLGVLASVVAESTDPGAMVHAVGMGWWGAILLTLATLTTNFVNIYMSALAFKTLYPAAGDRRTVWMIGGVGAALGLLSTTWLEQFANLVLVLAGAFVPIGGILLAHYVWLREPVRVADLYGGDGPYWRYRGWSLAGTTAWIAGAAAFALAEPIGATLPSLFTAIIVYAVAMRWTRKSR